MQVEIVKWAYEGGLREAKLKDLLDTRSVQVYNINRLESAHNLGERILCSQTELQFTDKVPVRLTKSSQARPSILAKTKTNFFANLLSLKSQAEATEKVNK